MRHEIKMQIAKKYELSKKNQLLVCCEWESLFYKVLLKIYFKILNRCITTHCSREHRSVLVTAPDDTPLSSFVSDLTTVSKHYIAILELAAPGGIGLFL